MTSCRLLQDRGPPSWGGSLIPKEGVPRQIRLYNLLVDQHLDFLIFSILIHKHKYTVHSNCTNSDQLQS